jgi:FtsP/CotA-like multicopper oxidase with cupredoxin domain
MRDRSNARCRRLASLGGLALLALVTSAERAPGAPATPAAKGTALTAAALRSAESYDLPVGFWFDPPEASWRGPSPYRLEVRYATNSVRVGDGQLQRVYLRSYNGYLVGPTFRVRPNDTLRIDLANNLPPGPPCEHGHGGKMEMNLDCTNLHTHGLHISPSDKADNVLREVPPRTTADYILPILPAGNPPGQEPMIHYPGTFWYHAHLHGATAVQLASGMAGAFFVEGNVDTIPEIRAARERTFVFQQLAFDKDGEVKSLDDLNLNWAGDKPGDPPRHGPKKHTTINGVVKPLIELRPLQVERWRMIDAGIFEALDMSLRNEANPAEAVPFHVIGVDGITLKAVRRQEQVGLSPGYRADLLVQAPARTGTYLLYKQRPAIHLTALTLPAARAKDVDLPEILAVVRVAGESCASPRNPCASRLLPAGTPLPAPLRDVPAGGGVRTATFSVVSGQFLINGRTFDPNVVHPDFRLRRGTTEEWVLRNTSGGPHPFHIHVNAFQMVNADGTLGDWRDTVVIPPRSELRMRTRIERFPGRFVLHCHILTHEDLGMMQLVEVAP